MASMVALCLLLCNCSKERVAHTAVFTPPVQISDYLYEMTYSEYEPSAVKAFFDDLDHVAMGGGCSVVRNGNFIGRNLDYYYTEMTETVIHVPAAPGRYASVGVASCLVDFTPKLIKKHPNSRFFDVLPYTVVDGINEKGVYCSVNVVPFDFGFTTGTNPGSDTLCATMVVRYVLDHASSALEACQLLATKNIRQSRLMTEMHYFIADEHESYVVETINNQFKYAPAPDNILTNFHLLGDSLSPYGMGYERYDLLKQHYDEGQTKEGMSSLMQKVRYSLSYDTTTTPYWFSEYYGIRYNDVRVGINTPTDFYWDYVVAQAEHFAHRKRSLLEFLWITTHTSVYDIANRKLRVYSQENYNQYWEFGL